MSLPDPGLTVKTDEQREQIVFGRPIKWGNETRGQFARISPLEEFGPDYITPGTFRKLIDTGYIEPDGRQNRSPTMERLCELGEDAMDDKTVDRVEYTGYMVGPERNDARIMLTAITIRTMSNNPGRLSDDITQRFEDVCQRADEFNVQDDTLHAWWD